MNERLKIKAEEIIEAIRDIPEVNRCTVYGSLTNGKSDELSDIDIEIDVSGIDNGQFMLRLVDLLKDKLNIFYFDYAPSLIPNDYIVSIALDESNPFLIADLKCIADPHFSTVTKQQARELNNKYSHTLKLWTANLKHYARGKECREDLVGMAKNLQITDIDTKSEKELLEETLRWLESNVTDGLHTFIKSCKVKYTELIKN